MGYNPLATKQAKVTVWVCEQDGETPAAPSNPSEGDCFVVYATDEAVLSNTPTSAKTYSNGEWIDAESGGGTVIPEITITATSGTSGTYTSTVPYQEMVDLLLDSPWSTSDDKIYPCFVAFSGTVGFYTIGYHGNKIDTYVMGAEIVFNEDGTCTIA